jgi:hypothetical protein
LKSGSDRDSRFTFSLSGLLLGCAVAAAVLTIAGLAWRGTGWASGAGWAVAAWLVALGVMTGFTGLLLLVAGRLARSRARWMVEWPRPAAPPAPGRASE